jgi:hypothetical protein
MDFHPVYNVHRPNHGMADALRKAMLVPHVLEAYLTNYETSSYFSGEFTKDAFGSMLPSEILAMQLAMIFEVAGRDSDIGFSDHPDSFQRFHRASCNAYKQFRSTTHENVRIYFDCFSHLLPSGSYNNTQYLTRFCPFSSALIPQQLVSHSSTMKHAISC